MASVAADFFGGAVSDRVNERRTLANALASAIFPDQTLRPLGCRQPGDDEADTLWPTGEAHWPLGTSRVVCPSLVVITSMIRPLPGREYLRRENRRK